MIIFDTTFVNDNRAMLRSNSLTITKVENQAAFNQVAFFLADKSDTIIGHQVAFFFGRQIGHNNRTQ